MEKPYSNRQTLAAGPGFSHTVWSASDYQGEGVAEGAKSWRRKDRSKLREMPLRLEKNKWEGRRLQCTASLFFFNEAGGQVVCLSRVSGVQLG